MASASRMDSFTLAYFEAALWLTSDESDDSGGEPLDKNYSIGDFDDATRDKMIDDCVDFQKRYAGMLDNAYGEGGIDSGRAGHNFWLSRNGHGAGFFDDDLDDLQEAAESYGEFNLYVGDDGEIHGSPLGAHGVREVRAGRKEPQRQQRAGSFVVTLSTGQTARFHDMPRAQDWATERLKKQPTGTYAAFYRAAVGPNRSDTGAPWTEPFYMLVVDEYGHIRVGDTRTIAPLPAQHPHRSLTETGGHHVADFNTLDDLIAHARDELGATHVVVSPANAWIYFPRKDGKYDEARTWDKGGYWHAEGPGARDVVPRLSHSATPIDTYLERRGGRTTRTVRDYEAIDRRDRVIAGPFKHYSDAKDAAGPAGAVRFVPSRGKPSKASETRSAHTPSPTRRRARRR